MAPATAAATAVPTNTPESTGSASACPVSGDPSYGYSQGNPVRVGGDAFGGPARARAYFDTLRGPQGQTVSYSRIGSVPTEETILDVYELTYDGIGAPANIYIDQYSEASWLAPVGFICNSPFPF